MCSCKTGNCHFFSAVISPVPPPPLLPSSPPPFSGDGPANWSTEGIITEVLEDGRVRCYTHHLTSFAVLLSATAGEDIAVRNLTRCTVPPMIEFSYRMT